MSNDTDMTIEGVITLPDGTKSSFLIYVQAWGGNYSQWGASTERLGLTVDLVGSIRDAACAMLDDVDGARPW